MSRYLLGTSEYALYFHGYPTGPQNLVNIFGYVDSDWEDDIGNKGSTNGYVFTMFGGAISWMSKRHVVVDLSTTEDEYMVATHACKESIWLKRQCSNIGFGARHITICCDS